MARSSRVRCLGFSPCVGFHNDDDDGDGGYWWPTAAALYA